MKKNALSLLFVLFILGCSLPTSSQIDTQAELPADLLVRSLSWWVENHDPSLLDGTGVTSTVQFCTNLQFLGTNFDSSLLQSLQIMDPQNNSYTIDTSQERNAIDENGILRVWGLPNVLKPHTVYFGDWRLTATFQGGSQKTINWVVHPPGATEQQTLVGAFSVDVASPGTGWVPVLARATAVSVQRSTDAVSVAFSVNDANVHDGWIEFFDSRDIKLGSTQRLRSFGGALKNDGTGNTFRVESTHLTKVMEWADVAKVRVVLTDGAQYSADSTDWRYCSFSAECNVPVSPPEAGADGNI
ncbi:MAG: hypothetical protein MI717_05550 [Spirochaetales bacterium]|nr:hypothetical protein [Spirochaetales bacterium]